MKYSLFSLALITGLTLVQPSFAQDNTAPALLDSPPPPLP